MKIIRVTNIKIILETLVIHQIKWSSNSLWNKFVKICRRQNLQFYSIFLSHFLYLRPGFLSFQCLTLTNLLSSTIKFQKHISSDMKVHEILQFFVGLKDKYNCVSSKFLIILLRGLYECNIKFNIRLVYRL